MSIRFYKRINIIPGLLWINVSKSGFSLSFGNKYVGGNISKKGTTYRASAPGTGLSYRTTVKKKKAPKEEPKGRDKDLDRILGR